jgi:molybdenum cofactor guanylyltransferase
MVMVAPMPLPLVGVFAGGKGSRMGGRDKAQLAAPGSEETLLSRLLRISSELGLCCVVVGGRPRTGLEVLSDDPPGIGPLGGLGALLLHAGHRPVIALACDLPYLGGELIQRLARCTSSASVVAPREPEHGKWETLCARYDAARVLPVVRRASSSGAYSLQALFAQLDVEELVLTDAERELLRDWDEPGDLTL